MKRTLITAAVLAALAGTQAFAQNTKQGVITFALSQQKQVSVSTSKTANNVGTWDAYPTSYKTQTAALNTLNVLQAISRVLHGTPSYYSSKAQLVLVQGELSGFFNVTPDISSTPWGTSKTSVYTDPLTGATTTEWGTFDPTATSDTSLVGGGTVPQLATGRHFDVIPAVDPATGAALQRAGAWPVGHHQPWGQIFVQDTAKSPMLCENVTFFFAITVQECYDCFFLNSFISDASFAFKAQNVVGPPCCSLASALTGNGKDRYYMTLTFDNTVNNPYLDATSAGWIGWGQKANPSLLLYNAYAGVVGLNPAGGPTTLVDGLVPDFFTYNNSITFRGFPYNPYVLRFALNGIVTYTWNLKLLNKSDVLPDFLGTATYACNGYGFVGLYCSLFTGTASIAEKLIKTSSCCLDLPWYDSWYGPGWDQIGNSTTRVTPVNIESSLTYHAFFDEEYEPGEQWGTNPASPTGP